MIVASSPRMLGRRAAAASMMLSDLRWLRASGASRLQIVARQLVLLRLRRPSMSVEETDQIWRAAKDRAAKRDWSRIKRGMLAASYGAIERRE